ncbi:MAG TPA: helix-turn-helix domain-containing protein [Virgibacillus sp.]|nr:helix-turn-helix domain-containing protein [Virgibacillus sp.]
MEGEIIKFFRERNKLTQSQLGEGICTTTHVSKIERGKTAYSEEIITLFSERLSINLRHEIDNLDKVETLLRQWQRAITMKRVEEMTDIKNELDRITIVQSNHFINRYRLLNARHLLIQKNDPKHSKSWNVSKKSLRI